MRCASALARASAPLNACARRTGRGARARDAVALKRATVGVRRTIEIESIRPRTRGARARERRDARVVAR